MTIDPFVTDATSPIMAVYQVPANATQWGLLRQVKWGSTIDNKKVGIVFDTTGGVFNAYLRVDDGQTVTDLRILTPADIPSDTGVISVNGTAGVVVLDATDILMETGVDTRTVQTVIAGLELDMSNAFTDIQTVNSNQADGFSTSLTYDVGDLVLHNDVLYKCIVAVTTAGTWNAANWQQTTLAAELGGGDDNLAYVEDGSTASRNYSAGDYIIWQGTAYQASTAIGSGTTLAVGTNLTAITGGVANALNTSLNMDVSNTITTITGPNASWTATENCFALAQMGGPSDRPATIYIDGVAVVVISLATSTSITYPFKTFIPVKKGQTVSTRNVSGHAYEITFVRCC